MTDASAFTDLYRRGQQAIAQEDGDAATAAFQALVKLAPASPLARLAAASCALLTGDLTTAEKHAGWLLGYVPGREVGAQALSLLGMVAFQRGDVELALRFHEAAAAAGADQATAQANRVTCLLALGRWREAWPLLAQPLALCALARFSGVPMWRGEGPPSHIDIHMDYMGAGDCIALVRFVPLIARRGHRVTLEVPRALVLLLTRSFPGATVTTRADVLPAFQLPLTFAPAVLAIEPDTVPTASYLVADLSRVAHYRRLLPRDSVGLCWASGPGDGGIDARRFMREKSMNGLADLRPIWSRFPCISLQVGAARQQVNGTPVLDVLPTDPDWDDTAALVAVLRCVVTVDTGTAHLAGAMGARTLVALHGLPNLHWMTDRPPWQDRSPWYPSATLYRRRAGTWGDVVARIVADLEA
jgi:hypothetical protein